MSSNIAQKEIIPKSDKLLSAVRIMKDFMEVINKNKENLHSA